MAMVTGSRRRSNASPTVASISLLRISSRLLMHWNMQRCRSLLAASTSCQKSRTCPRTHAGLAFFNQMLWGCDRVSLQCRNEINNSALTSNKQKELAAAFDVQLIAACQVPLLPWSVLPACSGMLLFSRALPLQAGP